MFEMLLEHDARALVEDRLASLATDGWTPIITRVDKFERCWIVFYAAAELDAIVAGNSPFLVDAATGAVFSTGTAAPVEEYVENYLRTGDPHG